MDTWAWWAIAAAALGVAEIVTGGTLVLLMLAGGAVAASVVAATPLGAGWSFIAFAAVSLVLLVAVRPIARRHRRPVPGLRTGIDALEGVDAEVLEPVDGHDGRIRLGGEIWSARSFDGESSYPRGTTVHVLQITGATALVAD